MSEKQLDNTLQPKTSKKSTKVEVDQRLTEVSEMILTGYTRSAILQHGSKWKVSDRQIDEYIAQASTKIKEINQVSLQDNIAILTSQYWNLWRQAGKVGDLSEQHKILNSIAKLKGLDKLTINHIVEDKRELADLSDADLEALLVQDEETNLSN